MPHRMFWLFILSCGILSAAQGNAQSSRRISGAPSKKSLVQKRLIPSEYEAGLQETCGGPPPVEVELMTLDAAPRDTAQPYTIVDQLPAFPNDLRAWIAGNVLYPSEAREAGIEGRVHVRFVVEVDGSLTEVGVVRGVSPGLDAEAVRLVNSMPCWEPGRQLGKAVRTYFSFPIKFHLDD